MADKASKPKIDRKARVQKPPHHARIRPPHVRVQDFEEVVIPYTREEAMLEASRCLQCANAPCQAACPLDNDIPRAIRLIEAGKIVEAAAVYRATSTDAGDLRSHLPTDAVHGGLHAPSDGKAHRHSASGGLRRRYPAGDRRRAPSRTCRAHRQARGRRRRRPRRPHRERALVRRGHTVVAYEKYPRPGGLLRYGIPRFKLNRDVVAAKVTWLEHLGARSFNATLPSGAM